MLEQKIAEDQTRQLTVEEIQAVAGADGAGWFTKSDSEPKQHGDYVVILYDIIDD